MIVKRSLSMQPAGLNQYSADAEDVNYVDRNVFPDTESVVSFSII